MSDTEHRRCGKFSLEIKGGSSGIACMRRVSEIKALQEIMAEAL